MNCVARIEGGFAETDAGLWLAGRSQPAAFSGRAARLRRKGWRLSDRACLDLVETTGVSKFADARRPFLTHIPCAAPVHAVSGKVLVAPASARKDARTLRTVPMSVKGSVCVTEFASEWVVMATASRTCRVQIAEGETLSVRPEAAVAWTGRVPTSFCPRISVWDVLLPRPPRDLLFTFYGPATVWIEGAAGVPVFPFPASRSERRTYGV